MSVCKQKKIERYILPSLMQPMFQILMLLDNNYNIFRNVEMGGNCRLENIYDEN